MAEIQTNETQRSELELAVATMRNRWRLILICLVASTLAALGFSLIQPKEYSASASLLFRDPGYAQALYGTAVTTASPDPNREAATNVRLVSLGVVANRTAEVLDDGLSGTEVASKISVAEEGESDVVSVTATDSDPERAALLANTFARQFIVFRIKTDRSKLRAAQRLAERQYDELSLSEQEGARGQALSRAAERLGVLASLQTGNAELVQTASTPSSPSSPQPKRNAALGAILGLLLGVGMAFLLERLDRRLRSPEEVGTTYDLPVLGTVPLSKDLAAPGAGNADLPFMEEESFRTMRAALRYFNVDRDVHSVLVTSHAAGEGKSTVAWNLARIAATTARVALLEVDLRNPTISRARGLKASPGLGELLTHQVDLGEAAQEPQFGGGSNGAGRNESLTVITAGATAPNPAELLQSQAMTDLLARLGGEFDFVVVDAPPVGVVSDAFPLLSRVTGVIVVTRIGMATRDSAAKLSAQLRQLNAPLLGVVANCVKVRARDRRGYGRGYYGRPEAEAEGAVPAAADR